MKNLVLLALTLLSFSSFAQRPCDEKQILAAKKQMAKDYGAAVKSVSFVNREPGLWTEMLGDNTGSDEITVALKRDGADYAIETYVVSAKQIGRSSDCKILNVKSI